MRSWNLRPALLLVLVCFSCDAAALSRRNEATEAARTFVPAFLGKRYAQAGTVATFDPATWASWFDTRFPTNEPFRYFRVFDVDTTEDSTIVHVRIRGESTVYGLYLRVDSRGKVTTPLSIRELLDDCQRELNAASGRTMDVLDAVEGRTLAPSSIRGVLRDHRRAAADYLRTIERHSTCSKGRSGIAHEPAETLAVPAPPRPRHHALDPRGGGPAGRSAAAAIGAPGVTERVASALLEAEIAGGSRRPGHRSREDPARAVGEVEAEEEHPALAQPSGCDAAHSAHVYR